MEVVVFIGGIILLAIRGYNVLEKMEERLKDEMKASITNCTIEAEKKSVEQEQKVDRAFKRMDELKIEYYKSFVFREVYDTDLRNLRERYDEKLLSLIALFTEKVESIKNSISDMKADIKFEIEKRNKEDDKRH